MVTRNDGYGENLIHRLNTSINSIVKLFENERRINVELVVVEWNPPSQHEKIEKVIEVPVEIESTDINIITVPEEMHYELPNSESIPFFEYVGKNVGIRRSKYENVLSTNSDVVFNRGLVSYLVEESISDRTFYRIRRYDVRGNTPSTGKMEKVLSYCRNNTYRVSTPNGFRTTSKKNKLLNTLEKVLRNIKNPIKILKRVRSRILKTKEDNTEEGEALKKLFTMTSGDFLLMRKKMWETIEGYRERGSNLHVDGLACAEALAKGMTQRIIEEPARLYHPEHDRSERDERPNTEYTDFVREAKGIIERECVKRKEDWGLKSADLDKVRIR